jgi:predicted aspartyl protease
LKFDFNPKLHLIIVEAVVHGPRAKQVARLAVDTGATTTLIGTSFLLERGCDPSLASEHVSINTASGLELLPLVQVNQLNALGSERQSFPVLAHNLPPTSSVDGLLGLDFFRNLSLTIDFRAGTIELV